MKTSLIIFTCSLLFSLTALASGEVSFRRLESKVTKIEIRTRLVLNTKTHELTLPQVKTINESLNNFLNLSRPFKDPSGERFLIKFTVTAVRDRDSGPLLPTDNFVDISDEGQDFASPDGMEAENYDAKLDRSDIVLVVGRNATISKRSIDAYSPTISHETLHLLGLDDRYHNIPLSNGSFLSASDVGFENDLMSSGNHELHSTHLNSYVTLVKEARKAGVSRFELSRVTNFNVGHISEKPQALYLVNEMTSK